MTGGTHAGDSSPLTLEKDLTYSGIDKKAQSFCPKTASGEVATYVRIGPKPTVGGFKDVYEGEYYADGVLWAVQNGITSGTGDGTSFSPLKNCTRGEIVTFLWRAQGSPKASGNVNFSDVKGNEYYADAVKWAVEEGITGGTGDGSKFSPNDPCTRAQAVTLMWRAAGEPSASGSSFADVPSGEYYADAVKWAVQKGVTSGTGNGFNPDGNCTRGQIVTFLYRGK